ncbi:Oxysterol-binding protein 2 [Cichlidogyrus casuarinus]|uniref:Oxysterol-binding protein 2 n=1 Tax=Cichlidogyrus casuarinus TaxID=1844966 RepID=A0ABD2Q889_9PLAT
MAEPHSPEAQNKLCSISEQAMTSSKTLSSRASGPVFSWRKLNCVIKKPAQLSLNRAKTSASSPNVDQWRNGSNQSSPEEADTTNLQDKGKSSRQRKNSRISSDGQQEAKRPSKSRRRFRIRKNRSQPTSKPPPEPQPALRVSDSELEAIRLQVSRDLSQLHEEESRVRQLLKQLYVLLLDMPPATTPDNSGAFCKKSLVCKTMGQIETANDSLLRKTSLVLKAWSDRLVGQQRRITNEQRKNDHLERVIEQLAKQHRILESQLYVRSRAGSQANVKLGNRSKSIESVNGRAPWAQSLEDIFFDAVSSVGRRRSTESIESPSQSSEASLQNADDLSDGSFSSFEEAIDINENLSGRIHNTRSRLDSLAPTKSKLTINGQRRRTSINPRPKVTLNLWSILKNGIGKDLSKLPLPVNFNEPLSVLQRAVEDLMYSHLLDKAAEYGDKGDYVMQMAYVAAFTVSSYAGTLNRTGKPFNPLLGETYECDRTQESYGWRAICEQSPKHGWEFRQDLTLTSKFRGKYLSVLPKGCVRLDFRDGSIFTWNKITTCVHNIIVGKLWIDNYGDAYITNHKTGHTAEINYSPYTLLSSHNRQVKGVVKDPSGRDQYVITGTWDERLNGESKRPSDEDLKATVLWTARPVREDADQIYNFNDMSVELNQPEEGVAPTDSRLRPDQRSMEEGRWNEANELKERLEIKQRARRARWEKQDYDKNEPYTPLWFEKSFDHYFRGDCYLSNGQYWKAKKNRDWHQCLNIFTVDN